MGFFQRKLDRNVQLYWNLGKSQADDLFGIARSPAWFFFRPFFDFFRFLNFEFPFFIFYFFSFPPHHVTTGHAGHSSLSHTTRLIAVTTKIRKACQLKAAEGMRDISARKGVKVEINVSLFYFFPFLSFRNKKISGSRKGLWSALKNKVLWAKNQN